MRSEIIWDEMKQLAKRYLATSCAKCTMTDFCSEVCGKEIDIIKFANKRPEWCPVEKTIQEGTTLCTEPIDTQTITLESMQRFLGDEQGYVVMSELHTLIDEYCGEEQTETWHGYHGDIIAPKGTFDRIYNDNDIDEEDI